MKQKLLVIICLTMLNLGFSQTEIWKRSETTSKNLNIISSKTDLPTSHLFSLDYSTLQNILKSSPKRGNSSKSNIHIPFPNSEGEMELYRVFEAPVLHPDLAKKYPGIKSYAGQNLNYPEKSIRFSISPLGLQSMELGGEHTVFIEPITKDTTVYSVFTRDQISRNDTNFKCLTQGTATSNTFHNNNKRNADDGILRTYRIAISATGEYTQFHGGTVAGALAAINTTMTRVNGIFERDFGVTMLVINNTDDVIYTNANTDPYPGIGFVGQTERTLRTTIGENNYDVGHLFAIGNQEGAVQEIGSICVNGEKGGGYSALANPAGDPFDVDFVAHEIGHQFGANHTWTHGGNERTNVQAEPGSGSTIMGYAGITGATDVQQNSDPYFHAFSIQQVTNRIKATTCQTNTNTGNSIPTADAGSNHTIPRGTPFVLAGTGTDANTNDGLTYCWEQIDENDAATTNPNVNATNGVAFRTFNPTTSTKRYFPRLATVKNGATSWRWEAIPNVTRALNFRLTVRDNRAGGGANESDDMRVNVTANAGPFVVNTPNTNLNWEAGTTQNVTWNVAGTTGNGVNAASVDIFLSTDGGDTYPVALATAVPNDGSHPITVPNSPGNQNRIMVKGSGNIFFDISNANFVISAAQGSDTQDPTAPSSLSASGATQTTINLSWTASTDNTAVTGYDVYQGNTVITSITTTSYTVTGLTADTSYSFRIKAKDAAGNISNFSNTATATTLSDTSGSGCSTGISSFPYNEGFENTIGAWTQSTNDNLNWSLDSNGTPSSNTGPSSAIQGSFYIFVEASTNGTGYPDKRAIITSPCFDLSGESQATFSFSYHMFGATDMGSITLEASTNNGNTWTSIWNKTGNQGNSWMNESISLASYVGGSVQLRFNRVTGSTWQADIAIDNVSLKTGTATPPNCTNVNLSITLDDYPEETSWQIVDSNNQVVASGGTYGSSPDRSTITETVCLNNGTYTFTINDAFGDGICCGFGNGSYSLTSGSTNLASGSEFGRSQSTTFTIGGSSNRIEVKDFVTTEAIKIGIFPNPVPSDRIINVIAPSDNIYFNVYDLQGRNVSKGSSNSKSIKLNGIQSGAYILSLTINGKLSNHTIIVK